jgi:vanillate O-demethylase ferredoxin subunit
MIETDASTPLPGDTAFEVVVDSTGASYTIPPGKTILGVLLDHGVDLLYDCQRGECGVCQVGVIEGVPDHRDSILSEAERAAGKVMQICVSRSKTPRLVLDL